MNILLVEDNEKLGENLKEIFEDEGYTLCVSPTLRDANKSIDTERFDLILLDLMLPDGDGIDFCKELRDKGVKTPILMVTARIDLESKVTGLDCGADDYITKPFEIDELLARVRSLLRRSGKQTDKLFQIADFKYNMADKSCNISDKDITLSPTETRILEHLLTNRGQAQSFVDICDCVWGHNSEMEFSDSLKVHIARLRKKIGENIIETIPTVGYIIK
jgi:DNA-binding response OmpR family regulator